MPKHTDYTLTDEEVERIQIAMRSDKARIAKRATVLYNLHQGYSVKEVSEMHQVSVATVYNYVERFQSEGIEGLPNKPIPGRPLKATAEYIDLLEQTLESDPQQMGFAFTIWTQPRLRAYLLEQTGISLSRARFAMLMQRLGYVYRRPKKDLGHKQDEELREQVKQALDEFKKTPKLEASGYSLWMKVDSA